MLTPTAARARPEPFGAALARHGNRPHHRRHQRPRSRPSLSITYRSASRRSVIFAQDPAVPRLCCCMAGRRVPTNGGGS